MLRMIRNGEPPQTNVWFGDQFDIDRSAFSKWPRWGETMARWKAGTIDDEMLDKLQAASDLGDPPHPADGSDVP